MSSYFTLTLDTAPPANPSIVANGGAPSAAQPEVLIEVDTSDYQAGARDVTEMRLWGDVDLSADPSVQADELTSNWQPYRQLSVIRLSATPGTKTIYARMRDDVGNETLVVSTAITYNPDLLYVTITSPVTRSRISKVDGYDEATFVWEASGPITAYRVRVVPSIGSPVTSGVPLGAAFGSLNVSGDQALAAATPVTTTITGADLQAASPGDTDKVCKVFVRDESGVWSP